MAIELIPYGLEIAIKRDNVVKFYDRDSIISIANSDSTISLYERIDDTDKIILTANTSEFINPNEDSVLDLMLLIKNILIGNDTTEVPYPSVNITDTDGSSVSVNAGGSYQCTPSTPIVKSGIAYCYPQPTGAVVSYALYDDAWQQVNNPHPPLPTNPTHTASLTDFFTLALNNKHGNLNRFTDVNGLQVYADDYIEDHYRGLGILRIPKTEAWAAAILNTQVATDLGFTDWKVANQYELTGLVNFGVLGNKVFDYAPLNISGAYTYISSTSYAPISTFVWKMLITSATQVVDKVYSNKYIICRNF
jgi:hypothetical protein